MRVCSYTYVIEGVPDAHFDYDGSPLLRCGRCRLIFYKDKAAQKAHYSYHQHSCKLIASTPSSFPLSSSDDATVAAQYPNLDACLGVLKDNIMNCPNLAAVLLRIRQLMDEDPGEAFNMGMPMHGWARGVIFYPGNIMAAVMGRPCMAMLMLCSADDDSKGESGTERIFKEDLLSNKVRVLKKLSNYGHGRPSEEFIRRIAEPEEKRRVERLCKQYDALENTDESGDPSSMSYCYLYFSLLVAAVVRGPSTNFSFHDGNGSIRGSIHMGPDSVAEYYLAIAALRRAMSLWSNLYVLDSCGDAMAPAAALAITGIRHCIAKKTLGGVACREDEIIPGLAPDAAVKACLCEILRKAISARYAAELLELLADLAQRPSSFWESVERPSLWHGLSLARRASCALAIVRFVSEAEDSGDGDDDSFTSNFGQKIDSLPLDECNVLFRAVTAMTEKDSNLTKAVLDLASAQGDCLGPVGAGRNVKGIAFFYFLSRGENYVKDLDEAIEQFDVLPTPGQAKDDELAMAEEKEECLKLAIVGQGA